VVIDFTVWKGTPSPNGYIYLLVVIDHFTKYVWTEAFKTKHSVTVAESLIKLFAKEGMPETLLSDNGGEFVSDSMKSFSYRHN
jgi:transposase InsO family protein